MRTELYHWYNLVMPWYHLPGELVVGAAIDQLPHRRGRQEVVREAQLDLARLTEPIKFSRPRASWVSCVSASGT
jgi:hypothetical protein